MTIPPHPDPLLEVLVEAEDLAPALTGWCVGFEAGEWRDQQLAKHLLRWLPEFALRYGEWSKMGAANTVDLLAKAAASIYQSEKYKKRGEFGEILLHAMIRQQFKSLPAIAKYYYKDSANDTVKGFDAVHVVPIVNKKWELWLGEVKFYNDIHRAIRDAVAELQEHTKRDYMRSEFAAITNKIDDELPQAREMRELLGQHTSLDKVFDRVCIPVLLTYDSQLFTEHNKITDIYRAAFNAEVRLYHEDFAGKALPTTVTVRLFLFPLQSKAKLIKLMDEALKKCQDAL